MMISGGGLRDIGFGTANHYGPGGSEFEPSGVKEFCLLNSRRDRLWGPPSLLYNWYRGAFLGGQVASERR